MTRPAGTAGHPPAAGGAGTGRLGGHLPDDDTADAAPERAHDLRSARRLVAVRAREWMTRWTLVGLALVVVVPTAIAVVLARYYGTLENSVWEFAGAPLGWAVFALAIIVGSVSLPLFVAYGISRRAVMQTYALLGAGLALASGAVMALGYAAEAALYARLGGTQGLNSSHLYDDPSQWGLVTLDHGLRGATMILTGWVVGLAFTRYEWGVGLAVSAAAFVPYGLGLWALAAWSGGVGIGLWAVVAAWVAGVAVLGVGAYLLGRDFPLRPKSA